ncbi:MBL fold metallo-hydrolase [Brachybacterium saurashtrense]|uniref:MBL fold metallo-hydrolase n=1 Tax=Brachybacterium saurashtrense TaxID=556288 RepID=A0A345YP59_9MICO|nr:MBL fold metallo-hydrolase [Brachybacterium saurashtrense]AXK45711.1 MBL fold metallo-hydrolase [Brachybacterium saurashtrense]RRR24729.1 MBL fold metallo-hydrolase [Brachybacterium saurashtrense]
MKYTHVRNATALLTIGGTRILVDPMLGAKGSSVSAPTTVDNHSRNPLVDLVTPLGDLLDVDAVLVTHTHPDHWDGAAAALLDRELPIFAQNGGDADAFAQVGFTDVRIVDGSLPFGDVTITRTRAQHGSDEVLARWGEMMGQVSGYVLATDGEPTVYIAGDAVWTADIADELHTHRPDVTVLNTGEARWADGSKIIMGAVDVAEVHNAAPGTQIVAVHMEALNHCVVTREDVRRVAEAGGFADCVFTPVDGETLVF